MTDDERDELLIRLDTKTDAIHERLNDHGKRLRLLENWRNLLIGGGAVIGAIGAALKLNIRVGQGGQ